MPSDPIPNEMAPAKLVLEDGTVYTGQSFGADGQTDGEVVFNTAMTGYQEILTDPSYHGQIVTMTYPEIGNYGVNSIDLENAKPSLAGFVVRSLSRVHSNYRSEGSLSDYLKENNIPAICGIDTRALVRRIRTSGAMRGVISTTNLDDDSLVAAAKSAPGLVGRDLVREVMSTDRADWRHRLDDWTAAEITRSTREGQPIDGDGQHIVCIDFGMKWNIPRHFASRGYRVTILPGTATANEVLAENPDGIFLSNGPGDPEPLDYAHRTIGELLGQKPIFGICLGHQLLSLACGAKTYKLKFGHRGVNQPVLDLATGKVEITTQNHGFAVDEKSLPDCLEITHRHLNDDTVAGVRHVDQPAFGVQFHPEAASGPHDSHYLFQRFAGTIEDAADTAGASS